NGFGTPLSPAFVLNNYLGATTFYNLAVPITGQGATVANVEGFHIRNTHEGLTQNLVRVTGTGGNGSSDDHPTSAAHVLAGQTGVDLNNRGLAYSADLWSGAISTSAPSGQNFSTTYQSQLTVYRPMMLTGVLVNSQLVTADVISSSWGQPFPNNDPTGAGSG